MSEQTEKPEKPENVNVVAVSTPPASSKVLTVGPFVLSILVATFTIAATISGGIAAIRSDINELRQHDIEHTGDITRINDKIRGYDALIAQRNQQNAETGERLARIETRLDILVNGQMRRDTQSDREGKPTR